jgi:hypothetical protein
LDCVDNKLTVIVHNGILKCHARTNVPNTVAVAFAPGVPFVQTKINRSPGAIVSSRSSAFTLPLTVPSMNVEGDTKFRYTLHAVDAVESHDTDARLICHPATVVGGPTDSVQLPVASSTPRAAVSTMALTGPEP